MASKRAVQLLSLRTPQAVSAHASSLRLGAQCARSRAFAPVSGTRKDIWRVEAGAVQRRWNSFPSDKKSKVYQFEDVLAILENPSDSTVLIDVREPDEFNANAIPTAINVPITSQPDSLLLPAEEFEDRFGFQKPPVNKQIVFYCKAGVRSSAAAQLAKQAGYENVGEYRGSWLDWEKNGGPGTKSAPPPGGKGEPTKAEIKETAV
ncbi:Rhodanese-like protein [Trematosphaeria pertusa]|uniref:Rhodanese-like protein n=1 Tax=Trematosphaeria pertusa TaxID=390896 RepID=A0A6A6I664_9PLEO|nr:Rhodanese-like protein [Trematosphaeria pertusa]KAF2245548.1 Rhodanese-like protein [Trematosphaeria pertusa]